MMTFALVILVSVTLATRSSIVLSQLYMDASQPIRERVADLLKEMTIDEQIAQLFEVYSDADYAHKHYAKTGVGWLPIPGSAPADSVSKRNEQQQLFMNSSRLHIPVGFTQESLHSAAKGGTVFPMPVTQGCSWNVTTVQQIAEAVAVEASAVGINVGFSPVLNMITDPRFGRLSEGFSEEPTLTSAYARAAVAGLQGDSNGGPFSYLDDKHILSLAKHYAAYGSESGGQNAAPAHISERTLREVYLKPWRAFGQAGGRGVMVSHESINSIPCHTNSILINDILRNEFNFSDGIAISDCNDIGVLVDYRVAENSSHAAAKALQAGLDIDLMCGASPDKWSFNNLNNSLNEGLITSDNIKTACSRVLVAKFASGLFDKPMADPSHISILNNSNHRSLAYDAAIEGLVLLKNFDEKLGQPVLPLQPQIYKRNGDTTSPISLAIIGPNAGCEGSRSGTCDSVANMLGPYTQHNTDVEVKTVFQAAVDSLGANYWVNFSRGCNIDDDRTDMIAAAVDTARRSDIAILVLGDSLHSCGEWSDRDSLDLPGAQMLLLESVINVTRASDSELKNVLVALVNGRPATFGPNNALLDSIDVLLVGYRPGQMGAQAIIDVLMRGVEPRGRLAQSWPRNVGQVHGASSPWLQEIRGKWIANSRSIADPDGRIYDPYVNSPATPLFYFGYGLSFGGAFNYTNPTATMTGNKEQPVEASVTVHNSGKSAGTEVVQVYLQDPIVDHVRYWKRLVGFQKIFLQKGDSQTVKIPLRMDDIAMYDDNMTFRIVEGTYTLRFGSHSGNDTVTIQISFQ